MSYLLLQHGEITLDVVFVAPDDDTDDEFEYEDDSSLR